MSGQRASVENADEKLLLLENLPTDVLIVIFEFCDLSALGRLSQVCRRFCIIISQDFLWLSQSKNALVTNQVKEAVQSRSLYHLKLKDKCRISYNWKRGKYEEKVFFCHKTKYMPWLSLESDLVWLSKGNCIQAFERRADGLIISRPLMTLKGHTDDVCRFVNKNGMIISGGRDGAICGWSANCGRFVFCRRFSHTSDVNAVDLSSQVMVSGSRDKTVKVWTISEQRRCTPCHTISIGDRVWSVAIGPVGDLLCCGSAGHHQVPPLHLYDLQRGVALSSLGGYYRDGAGVLDLHWESPHVLLSCGYDTYIRLWDTRTGYCMASWEDPHDSVIYTLASDSLYTVLCGTSQHGRVQLWDKRQKRSVQMFYVSANHSSPVYSVAFDPCQLFAALDQSLNVLDFTGYRNNANGYM